MSTVALYCFFQFGMGRGARKHQKHFSNRLTLSIEFFKVPCRSSLLYTPSTPPQSFILLLVMLQSVFLLVCSFQYNYVSSRSVSQALLSFTVVFRCFEAVFLSFLLTGVSHSSSSSHKFNFCCYAPNLAFYNHASRMRNEVQVR